MNILVIGTGYVGTTTALVLAEMGWNVTGLDTDVGKIERLRQGLPHFYEPGVEPMLRKQLDSGRLRFTAHTREAIEAADTIFICVGTPPLPDGSADLRYIKQVAEDIGRNLNAYKLVVIKSTVPVGTQRRVAEWVGAAQTEPKQFDVVSNPEFLREGKALYDALHPDRIIIGADTVSAGQRMKNMYHSMDCPILVTTPKTAELIKYAANSFLATKISYINELSRLCDKLGINVKEVAQGIGLDPRIGTSFLQAGIGYGGSCFPKDVASLLHTAHEHGSELKLLEEVVAVNRTQYMHLLEKARARLGDFSGKKVALLGLAFKPDTDDIRESIAIRIAERLVDERAYVAAHDPAAVLPAELCASVAQCSSVEQAMQDAHAVFLCTEWDEYLSIDWAAVKHSMHQPNIFDGRNVLDAGKLTTMGFFYQGVGYR
ncbi:UDP-glucose dehydrogenase family protein [Paenibacillus xerothermodurans]|uniref:UDP-glucose 6-dehydrogenase n=1 Tax=Paenibacillus xerothermodurans TaxID=1977292 RepID=A0A2W1NCF6_PAEXE|nr:UDP-glucose/GDP-mannose dehydrogenase family protein [Paenibacillus xerothermodurans]PZE21644.1 UDP-glucose/GDP-mannose dehydrogenase family protein [Paenibacillus xerothermodurans]